MKNQSDDAHRGKGAVLKSVLSNAAGGVASAFKFVQSHITARDAIAGAGGFSFVIATIPPTPSLLWAGTAALASGLAAAGGSKLGYIIGALTGLPNYQRPEGASKLQTKNRARLGWLVGAAAATWVCHVAINERVPHVPRTHYAPAASADPGLK